MRAYFVNSRTGRHGTVDVTMCDETLGRFVGGAFVRNLVTVGGTPFLVVAEFGEEPRGNATALRADGQRMYGNLLVLAFDGLFEERDMTDCEAALLEGSFPDGMLSYGEADGWRSL